MSDDLKVQVIKFNLGKNYDDVKKDTLEVKRNSIYSSNVIPADTITADSTYKSNNNGIKIVFVNESDVKKAEEAKPAAELKGRHELSWGEIGEITLNSGKNFVKSMFCDENGFSLKRTAATVGVVAGLALAAPVAAAAGASTAVVAGVAGTAKLAGLGIAGYMAYSGGKNVIEGTQKYYDSTTEAEAKASMSQAMDGAVEFAAAVPAFGIIKGGAAKGKKMASKKAEAPKAEPKPAEEVKPAEEPKPVQEVPVDYNKIVETTKDVKADGTVVEHQWNSQGEIVKSTRVDKDGKFYSESAAKYDSKGERLEYTYKSANGYESTEFYKNGVVEKIKRIYDGDLTELTRVSDGIYEGIRTQKDGTQIKVRYDAKTYETTELGAVE